MLQITIFKTLNKKHKTFLFRPSRFTPEDCPILQDVLNDSSVFKLGNGVTDDLKRMKFEGYISSSKNFSAVEFGPLYESLGETFPELRKCK